MDFFSSVCLKYTHCLFHLRYFVLISRSLNDVTVMSSMYFLKIFNLYFLAHKEYSCNNCFNVLSINDICAILGACFY